MEDSLIEHYTELSEKFSGDPRFLFFFRPVGNWGGDRVKQLCDNMYNQSSFKEIYKLLHSVQSKLQLNFGRYSSFYDNSTCSACYENSYIIGFDGSIYKCSCHFEEPDNKIGFLEDDGVMKIDKYLKNKWVNAPLLKASCKNCFFAPACSNMACPIYANGIKNGSDSIDDCPYEKKYIKETLLLLEENGFFKTITL